LVIPTIIDLQKAVEKKEYTTSVKTGWQVAIKTRLSSILSDEHFILSSGLDPQFTLKWVPGADEQRRIRSLVLLKSESNKNAVASIKSRRTSGVGKCTVHNRFRLIRLHGPAKSSGIERV